jgi:hypothetical protein
MLVYILRELEGDPYFLPLAAIFAVLVVARLTGQRWTF